MNTLYVVRLDRMGSDGEVETETVLITASSAMQAVTGAVTAISTPDSALRPVTVYDCTTNELLEVKVDNGTASNDNSSPTNGVHPSKRRQGKVKRYNNVKMLGKD